MEQVTRFELVPTVWRTVVLPLTPNLLEPEAWTRTRDPLFTKEPLFL